MIGDDYRQAVVHNLYAEWQRTEQRVSFGLWVQWQTKNGHHYSKRVKVLAQRMEHEIQNLNQRIS